MSLQELRAKIDSLDDKILSLLQSRMELVLNVAHEKESLSSPILDRSREDEIFQRLCGETDHAIIKEFVPQIYQEILKCSKAVQSLRRESTFPFTSVGIIGLGLMGGSVASILKWKSPHVRIVGLDPHVENCPVLDKQVQGVEELIDQVDLIVIASPMTTVTDYAQEIANLNLRKDLVVIDIASVKSKQKDFFESLSQEGLEFVATHPMSGSTVKGFKGSKTALFSLRPWIICPHQHNRLTTLAKVEKAIYYFGSYPLYMDAIEHDQSVAFVSHLPKVLSLALLKSAKSCPKSLPIAGRGFEIMTELGKGNPELINDLIKENRSYLASALDTCVNFAKDKIEDMSHAN